MRGRHRHQLVGGQRERNRSRARGAEQLEGALHRGRKRSGFTNRLRPAADWPEALDLVGQPVECADLVADQRRRNVRHEGQHRLRAGVRFDERCERVGRARSRRDQDHAGTAGRTCVAVGHECRALLVTSEDVRDPARAAHQRIVDGEVVDPRDAEDVAHAFRPQCFNHPLATRPVLFVGLVGHERQVCIARRARLVIVRAAVVVARKLDGSQMSRHYRPE